MWSDKLSLSQVLRAVAQLGFALFVGSAAAGLWVLAGEPGWPGYFAALRVHVWAGNALLVVALPALLAHLWVTGSRPFLSLLVSDRPERRQPAHRGAVVLPAGQSGLRGVRLRLPRGHRTIRGAPHRRCQPPT